MAAKKSHSVWIEFNDGKDPVTLTKVEGVSYEDGLFVVDWMDGKSLRTNYYPIPRIQRIHETQSE